MKRVACPTMSGAELRGWRERRGLTREQLANLLGLHRNSIRNLETGEGTRGEPISVRKILRLALFALSQGVQDYDGTAVHGSPLFFLMNGEPREPHEKS